MSTGTHSNPVPPLLDNEPLNPSKEKHKDLYAGKLKKDPQWRLYQGSVNDDLEDLITKLSKSEEIDIENVQLFFTPKLTKEELKLVEQKDETYLLTLSNDNPDVDPEEMKKSDSKDKFVYSSCWRRTKCLTIVSAKPKVEEIDISKMLAEAEAELASWTPEDYERVNRRPRYPFDK